LLEERLDTILYLSEARDALALEVGTVIQNKDINPEDWEKFERSMQNKEQRAEGRKEQRKDLRKKFETLKSDSLRTALKQRLGEYYWNLESHPEGMDGRQRVDIVGEPNSEDHLVFVEVEGGRTHPIDNVVKAWRYTEKNVDSKPILLVQIFSPYFYAKTGNKRRMAEAIFIGKKAEKAEGNKLRYEPLGQEYWPPTKDTELSALVERISLLIANYRRNK
jgi:hypothetical protein